MRVNDPAQRKRVRTAQELIAEALELRKTLERLLAEITELIAKTKQLNLELKSRSQATADDPR
jgi:hypothetical protein